jgi:hypothetical protein
MVVDITTLEDLDKEDREVLLRLQQSTDPDIADIGRLLRGIILRLEDFYNEFVQKQTATKDVILDHQLWLENINNFLGGSPRRVVKQPLPPLTRDPNIISHVLELRSQGMSIREISSTMDKQGLIISKSMVAEILKEHTTTPSTENTDLQ